MSRGVFGDNNKGGDGKKYEAHASFCLACRCFGRGGETALVDDKTTLLPVLSKYWTGQEGESQTVRYCNI